MATAPPRTSLDLIAITTDAATTSIVSSHGPSSLPFGGCNFVDLAPGSSGAHCGCRRFWTRPIADGSPVQADWCMCGHHACYHDDGPRLVQSAHAAIPPVRGDQGPRSGTDLASLKAAEFTQGPPGTPKGDLGIPGLAGGYRPLTQATLQDGTDTQVFPTQYAPDALVWTGTVQPTTQSNANVLSRPLQYQISSPTASTASSLRTRYLKPFSGKGTQMLKALGEPASQPSGSCHRGTQSSLHKQNHSPSYSKATLKNPILDEQNSQSQPQTPLQAAPLSMKASIVAPPDGIKSMTSVINDLDYRIDRLEGDSLQQEYSDRFDNHDVRISDLEMRIDDVEKVANMANVRDLDEDGTWQSTVSTRSAPSNVHYPPEVMSRIDNIEAQVNQLQTFLPSFNYSWDVEVVFLPFSLKRVWQELHEFKSDTHLSDGEWTPLPMTLSALSRRSQSPFINEWASDDHDAEWMLPRACGDSSMVDKRLRSRGLIHSVSVKGPDYRSVCMAIHSAFGKVFKQMRLSERSKLPGARLTAFLGLQQIWVPLRKIHKDSRLRFLCPPEMVTPVSWDVPFLNTIMMKSATPRLYITHPDAYLQDAEAWESAWTWQKLRLLSRVYPDVTESQEGPEADAFEACWAWQEHLDEAQDTPSVSKGRKLHRSTSSSLMQTRRGRGRASRMSLSPGLTRSQSSVLSRRRETVPESAMSAAPLRQPSTSSKRRVVSHGQAIHTSSSQWITPQTRVPKRRRTRSPTLHRFTPRWSASPSPMPMDWSERHGQRGTTPLAYATPYSNAAPQEVQAVRRNRNGPEDDEDDEDDIYVRLYEHESESDESMIDGDDGDTDDDNVAEEEKQGRARGGLHGNVPRLQSTQADHPWPGIENQNGPSDSEIAELQDSDDDESDSSSNPSEYPSADILADDRRMESHADEDY